MDNIHANISNTNNSQVVCDESSASLTTCLPYIDNNKIHDNEQKFTTDCDWTDIIETIQDTEIAPVMQFKNNFLCTIDNKSKGRDEKIKIFEHKNIADIKFENFKTMHDLDILEKASQYVKCLKYQFNRKYDENENNFIKLTTLILEWLRDAAFELADRNAQSININIQKKNWNVGSWNPQDKVVSRNSYKFCEYGHMCKFNYDLHQKCYSQHYVYNLVYMDIVEILEYIVLTYGINNMDRNEIKISINTIAYVINHMFDELEELKITRPDKYINYENRSYRFKSVSGSNNKKMNSGASITKLAKKPAHIIK
jgi:hypothetical protein